MILLTYCPEIYSSTHHTVYWLSPESPFRESKLSLCSPSPVPTEHVPWMQTPAVHVGLLPSMLLAISLDPCSPDKRRSTLDNYYHTDSWVFVHNLLGPVKREKTIQQNHGVSHMKNSFFWTLEPSRMIWCILKWQPSSSDFDPLNNPLDQFEAPEFNMSNMSTASSYVRTCHRIKNRKKITNKCDFQVSICIKLTNKGGDSYMQLRVNYNDMIWHGKK